MPILETNELTRRFGALTAVDALSIGNVRQSRDFSRLHFQQDCGGDGRSTLGKTSARSEEMTEMKIEIVKTVSGPDVFRAAIEGEPGIYEEGSTSSEALGELVRRYPERFGVTHLG